MPNELAGLEHQEKIGEQGDTVSTAKKMASIVVSGMKGGEATAEGDDLEIVETEEEVEEVAEEGAEAKEGAEAEEGEEGEEEVDIAEIDRVLAETGLDLGYTAADVPAELLPTFRRMVEAAVESRQAAVTEKSQAAALVSMVEEFSTRLQKEPDKLLLSIAINNPEAFEKATQVFSEMQSDERLKDLVLRELATEARLREVDRKEKLAVHSNVQERASQVIRATKLSAKSHGVPYALAEEVVAMTVQANEGNLNPSDVDTIVQGLAEKLGGVKAPKKPRLANPSRLKPKLKAPVSPTGDAAPPTKTEPSKGLDIVSPHDRLRRIISGAAAKFRESQQ